MTEFGKHYYPLWKRGRKVSLALGLAVSVILQWFAPTDLMPYLIALILIGLFGTFFVPMLVRRVGQTRAVTWVLVSDLVITAFGVEILGGPASGFAALYILVALNTILLLGRRTFVRITLLILILFTAHILLLVLGLLPPPRQMPLAPELVGQSFMLGALLLTSYMLARASAVALTHWRDEQASAQDERAQAEDARQRWALVNAVALRVQESTTPQQVYTSIGEELERAQLHCAVLEWAEPDVSFQIVHTSQGALLTEFLRAQLQVELFALRLSLHEKSVLARAIASQYPVLVQDALESAARFLSNVPRSALQMALERFQANTMLFAPMLNQERVSGLLLVWGSSLNENDRAPLAALAQQAASALDKARLLTEQRKRAAQLELVSAIAVQVSTAENAEQIIQPLVRQVVERFGYDVASIVLVDEAHGDLYTAANYSAFSQALEPSAHIPLTRGILGLVARTGETYWARDTRADPHYFSPHPERDPIRSELAIALRAQNRILGVLDVESAQPDAFDASDVNALTLLAAQVSAALTKTRALALEQKRAAQLALVSEIAARAAMFSDPDVIVRTMVELVQQRFGYHHVCVSLYDSARNEMEQRAAAGLNKHLFPLGNRWDASKGLIGLAARTRQTIYSGDLRNDPRYTADPDRTANSALCVPLVSGKTVLGVLDVESEALNAFDANDIGAMETLANQMAAALEKARSLQAERRRAAQMALVNRIASRTARLIPTQQLVRDAVDMIRAQFGYYNVAVLASTEEERGVNLIANAGGLLPVLRVTENITNGIIGYVAASGNTYLCPNPEHDPRYVSPFPNRADDPVKAELAVPLRRGDTVIGVLDIQSAQADIFNPSDITALEALADQLAAALENARLFESEKEHAAQLEAVRVLSLKLTAEHDLDALLNAIVASAAELVQADGSTLYIMDETRGDLVIRISNSTQWSNLGFRLQLGEGIAGRVAERGEPILLADYTTWEGRAAIFANQNLARVMSVPLKWHTRVLGVINLHRPRERPEFKPEELRIANLFAAQAAIAMENARLLGALQARLEAQQLLTVTSGALLETTDPQAILERAAAAVLDLLDCDAVCVFVPDDDGHLAPHASAGNVPADLKQMHLPVDLGSTPGAAFLTQRALHWSDTDAASLAQVSPAAQRAGFRAGIAVPMLVGEHAVGVITGNTFRERVFKPDDWQSLSLLANQTASALERARSVAQVRRRVHELDLLFEGYRATTSTLEPEQVIARLLEQLVRALDVTSAFFVRVNETEQMVTQTHEFFSEYAHDQERTIDTRVWRMDQMPELNYIIARHSRVTHVTDADLSPLMRGYMLENNVYTILRVPLVAADEVLGYISLWETRAPRHWKTDEMRFVETMASQAGAALLNAQLYQAARTRTRELQALHEASHIINSTLEVRAICERGVDALRDILGYHHVSIYFLDQDFMRLQVQRGYDQVLDPIPVMQGVMGRAVRTRELIFVPDVRQDPNFLAALPNVQSEIAVPLLTGERVVGALNVETIRAGAASAAKNVLTLADAQLLTTFANQLAVAIENARLFQETQQALDQVRTLHRASQAVNADLKLEAVLEQVVDQFIAALNVDSCTISELDPAQKQVITLLDRDPLPRAYAPIGTRFELSFTEREILADSSGRARTFRRDDPQLGADVVAQMERFEWLALMVAPLVAKGQVIGYVELGERKRFRLFDADELQLAESLANQAALAIHNARLYRAAQKQLQETETLYRFARELGGTLDIEQLGKRALEAAARLTDFDIGEVSLVRESDGALAPFVITGVEYPLSELVIPYGEGVTGWVVEHGRTVRLGDVTRDPRYLSQSPHMMSELCVPLRVGSRVIGVLNLEAKAPNAFDARAEELMLVFANQLAIAIDNARLYEQTKRDAEVKAALLRELSHRVKNNLAAITSLLYMALDEPSDTREQILNETLGRVQSMALAHALLARSGEARVNLTELGRQVLHDTVRNLTLPGKPIEVHVNGDMVQVGARQTTTLALVLNELATNSLRHGFEGASATEAAQLRFTVRQLAREVECFLEDNGLGLPDSFLVETNAGLGLNLVRTLVEKDLHGHFHLARHATWTRAEIRFRLEEL